MTRYLTLLVMMLGLTGPDVTLAQDQTLADIRQELTVLNVEVQRLRRELSTTTGVNVAQGAVTTLDRLDALESELRRLTEATERLEFRIDRVVSDGTNKIGDLEFRLCELEADCDISALGDTPLLGGANVADTLAARPAPQPETQLASQERADFDRAQSALTAGDFRAAADQFATFNQTYPGGPLAIEAELRRGEAIEGTGDVREAARAYLSAFSLDQFSPQAPEALYRLGAALGRLGKTQEACVTLAEVGVRFPGADAATDAETAMRNLVCS